MLLWRALTGDAMLLISHFRDEDLLCWDAGQRILDVLAQAHKHISEFEDQDDFDNAFYKLHQEQFAQWQLCHQQYQHLQYQLQLVEASTTDPWQVLPEDGGFNGDRWSMDTGTDRIGV